MKTLIKIFAWVLLLAFVLACFKYCGKPNPTYPDLENDSLRFENIKIRMENDFLIQANKELDSLKTPRLEVVYQTREVIKYIRLKPDSIRLTDSSYCRLLETENTNLWYIVGLDSQYIVNQKAIISGLNKTILNDSTMLAGCEIEWRKQAENARKAEARLNRESFRKSAWKTIALVASGVLVYLGVSK